jgi:hypothetical protein
MVGGRQRDVFSIYRRTQRVADAEEEPSETRRRRSQRPQRRPPTPPEDEVEEEEEEQEVAKDGDGGEELAQQANEEEGVGTRMRRRRRRSQRPLPLVRRVDRSAQRCSTAACADDRCTAPSRQLQPRLIRRSMGTQIDFFILTLNST